MSATAITRGPSRERATDEAWVCSSAGGGAEVGFAVLPGGEGRPGLWLRVRVTDHPGATPLTVAEVPASAMVLGELAALLGRHVDRARALDVALIDEVFRRSAGLVGQAW